MKITLLHLSDTHGQHHKFTDQINQAGANIIMFSGDFSNYGIPEETEAFLNWLRSLKVPHKILIAGNHDEPFFEVKEVKNHFDLRGIHYLENSGLELMGLKIYGTPVVEMMFKGAFCYSEEEAQPFWQCIPTDVDILITHQPPKGVLDQGKNGKKLGSQGLRKRIAKIPHLKAHLFGHIHESYGIQKQDGVQYSNASYALNVFQMDGTLKSINTLGCSEQKP